MRFSVMTISDRSDRKERPDESGPVVRSLLETHLGGFCVASLVLPDERDVIRENLIALSDAGGVNLIVTAGGTGLTARDVTPEATRDVIDREVPGMAEAMRSAGLAQTPYAMLSRGLCGIRGRTLIVNLSGSPKAVREQLSVLLPVLPHALRLLDQDGGDDASDLDHASGNTQANFPEGVES